MFSGKEGRVARDARHLKSTFSKNSAAFIATRRQIATPEAEAALQASPGRDSGPPKPLARPAGACLAAPNAARPSPASPEMPAGLRRVGVWWIIAVDAVGKRATCKCANCGSVRENTTESLSWLLCGCARRQAADRSADPTFASDIALVESRASARRHRTGGMS
jgi:hypothetical protein